MSANYGANNTVTYSKVLSILSKKNNTALFKLTNILESSWDGYFNHFKHLKRSNDDHLGNSSVVKL